MLLLAQLALEIREGRVRQFAHPELPLTGYNYTEICQFDKGWNDVNTQCRGLILDSHGTVVARPFRKFFNYEELGETEKAFRVEDIRQINKKEDGSLIIAFYYAGAWRFCTRGSFVSQQAYAAELLWSKNSKFSQHANKHCTYLFELVGPGNINVVRNYQEDELILLGIIETLGGNEYVELGIKLYAERFGCNYARSYQWNEELFDMIKNNTDPNFEGIVVMLENGLRFKLKSTLYCQLHRVITGDWTPKRTLEVWMSQREGKMDLDPTIPDEFYTDLKVRLTEMDLRYENFRQSKLTLLGLMKSYVRQKYQEEEPDYKAMRKDLALTFPNSRPFLNLFFCGAEFLMSEWDTISYKLFCAQDPT